MRTIFTFLIFCKLLFSLEQDYINRFSDISYGGMVIQCDLGCGECDDPDFLKITRTFARCIDKVFQDPLFILDDELHITIVRYPWGKGDPVDWDYNRWVWEKDIFWPPLNVYCKLRWLPTRETISISNYENFKFAAKTLRKDLEFYYLKQPRFIIEKLKPLIPKLEKGHEDGYRYARVVNQNELIFHYYAPSPSYFKIVQLIDHTKDEIAKTIETLTENEKEYNEKKILLEKAEKRIDAIFKEIFVYCLKNHQIEGRECVTAIEHLIGGDYHKALNQIEFLLNFAKQQNMKSEFLGKLNLLKGQLHSEFSLYSDAILALTEAI